MEQLNLKITRPYHNIYAMDSREVKVVGIVLGFPVQLAKYLDIHLKMDILVIDVPDKWGILLSRRCAIHFGDPFKWSGLMPPFLYLNIQW